MLMRECLQNQVNQIPILRTIEQPKLSRKEKAAIKAKLKKYDAVD